MFDVFQNVLAEVRKEVGEMAFKIWFEDVALSSLDEKAKVATIGAPNVFKITTLEAKYKNIILKAFEHNGISLKKLDFVIKSSEKTRVKAREIRKDGTIKYNNDNQVRSVGEVAKVGTVNKVSSDTPSNGLFPRYTFDNFVVGSNNTLAAGVAKLIAKNPGKKYNPFFLYGGPGLGKTHLVQAIGNAIVARHPDKNVLYVTMNHFYSEFIRAVKADRGNSFVKKYQKLDVLIIDDFQMIVGKDRSQEEFFNIFNDLYQANKQIIVTCDRLPDQIKTLDERLASRLTWGGAYDLHFPGFEDRCAILKVKAEYLGLSIEDEAVEYIAESVKTNIRDLEGEFQRLMATSEIRGMTPLELINEGYFSGSVGKKQRNVTAKMIVERVAKYYNLSVVEMTGKSRVSNIMTARQVTMYLLSKELGLSTPKIALEVGVKDHTTVMSGLKRIEKRQATETQLQDQIKQIREAIYG